jgi:hypothetical protein
MQHIHCTTRYGTHNTLAAVQAAAASLTRTTDTAEHAVTSHVLGWQHRCLLLTPPPHTHTLHYLVR